MKSSAVFLLLFSAFTSFAQTSEIKDFNVKYTDQPFTIDGVLDERQWSEQLPATDFWQYFPTDTLQATQQTEIYMYADDKNLYVGIKCYAEGNDWLVNSLKRDYRAGGNTFNDQTNGIFFGINPEGVIREGVITNGGNGRRDFSESWDNKWKGEAQKYDGYYTAEMEIPFSTLRYNDNNTTWGFMAYRFDTQSNENSVWNRVPRNQTLFSLAYAGDLNWERPLTKSKKQVSLIPFVTAGITKDFEARTDVNSTADIGGDVKVGITSGLNLDLTINPDFSQVEVDRQITNLSRFEIFFPERRQFFIENADLFGNFGFSGINPFFSRRIGVGRDASTGSTVQNRIIGGARLSGKLDQDTRIGVLNMQTAEENLQGLPSINYSVIALQRKVLGRSNFGLIAINKQSFGENVELSDLNKFNRTFGADFNFASDDNTWFGKTFLHTAIGPSTSAKLAHGTEINYNKRSFGFSWTHQYVQDDYNAEVGFIRRTNYVSIEPQLEFKFYPQNDFINDYRITGSFEGLFRPGFGRTDQTYQLQLDGRLANSSRFFFSLNHDYVYLFNDFDPTGTSSTPLAADTEYNYINFFGFFGSDQRKRFSASTRANTGKYFNGWRTGLGGSITYRYQPKGSIELNYSWNIFDMPHLEETKQTLLIGPRIDYTFSKSLFLTAFVQYNTQAKNTNVNTRLQWRFAPVSDFFIVYTDNYFTGNLDDPSDRFTFQVKNRAIVAKMTYWINV